MESKKEFYLIPLFMFCKNTNALSEDAKISFDCKWNYIISLNIGWLIWKLEIVLIVK